MKNFFIILLFFVVFYPVVSFSQTQVQQKAEIRMENIEEIDMIDPLENKEDRYGPPSPGRENIIREDPVPINEKAFDFETIRDKRMSQIQERALETQKRATALTEERSEIREEKEKEYMERLQKIKEDQLREKAEAFTKNMNRVNIILSERYIGLLAAFEIVLNKIEDRTSKIEESTKKDLSFIYDRIDEGRNIIEDTREEIIIQKNRLYFPEISSEDFFREEFQKSFRMMRSDHHLLKERAVNSIKFLREEIIEELKTAIIN